MHQFGVGLPQDLHIAKRYYDQSLEHNPEGFVPVTLALIGLQAQTWYQDVFGESENVVVDPETTAESATSESETDSTTDSESGEVLI